MSWLRRIALMLLGRFGANLRYPQLFLIAGVCFLLDVLLPDGLPFLDELWLGLTTLFFALWRKRRSVSASEVGGGAGGGPGAGGVRGASRSGGDRR
jgi:Family of unknown function (DUF6116)